MEALSKDELRRLLGVARASRERDWLMILVAFWHGLRASEVVSLTRDNLADGMLTVKRLKGSNKTVQPLVYDDDPLFSETPALIDYAENRHANQLLFPIGRRHFWTLFQRYCEQAAIPERFRHPHILKHSIALQTIQGAGVENLKTYLGHKSLASTGSYLKRTDEEAAASVLRAAQSPAKL